MTEGESAKAINDAQIVRLKEELRQIPRTIDRRSCMCVSEGGACHHRPEIEINEKWQKKAKLLREAQATSYCVFCARMREDVQWIRCPYCMADRAEWTGTTHSTPACLGADPTVPYCWGCGKLN
jgi:hypothetical protein